MASCQWTQVTQDCKLSVETDDKIASCRWTQVTQDGKLSVDTCYTRLQAVSGKK